jgi:antitoxin PrlF
LEGEYVFCLAKNRVIICIISKAKPLRITFHESITLARVLNEIVCVTKKGQATIPKRFRTKYRIKDKVVFEETKCGLVLKAVPTPDELFGSYKEFAKGKTARQLLEEARREEFAKDSELMSRAGKSNI